MEPTGEAGRVGGLIPHFFFDVIGRIIPGGFLVAGALFEGWSRPWSAWIRDYTPKTGLIDSAINFVTFVSASFVVGFLLGAASYLIEKFWALFQPWKLQSVRERYGADKTRSAEIELSIVQKFGVSFGAGDMEHTSIHQMSWLCAYYVWGTSPHLGVLTSRWDAEALASRSLLFSSVGLAVYSAVLYRWLSVGFFVACVVGSLLAYHYHRRKQVFGRFDLYLASVAINRESAAKDAD